MYLLEGIATVLFGVVVYAVLPDYPKSKRSNSWLTPREQEYIEARLTGNAPKTHEPSFDKTEVKASLKDWRTYSFMAIHFTINMAGYALSWQLPTITTDLGYAGLPRNQLLNIPPAAGSVLTIIFAGWFLRQAYLTRPMFIMIINVIVLVFFGILAGVSNKAAIYSAIVVGDSIRAAFFIPFFTWRSSTLSGATGQRSASLSRTVWARWVESWGHSCFSPSMRTTGIRCLLPSVRRLAERPVWPLHGAGGSRRTSSTTFGGSGDCVSRRQRKAPFTPKTMST